MGKRTLFRRNKRNWTWASSRVKLGFYKFKRQNGIPWPMPPGGREVEKRTAALWDAPALGANAVLEFYTAGGWVGEWGGAGRGRALGEAALPPPHDFPGSLGSGVRLAGKVSEVEEFLKGPLLVANEVSNPGFPGSLR